MTIAKFIDTLKYFNNIIKNTIMYFFYYNIPICKKIIYIESRDGEDIADNIICIIKELKKSDYENFIIFLYLKRKFLKKKKIIIKNCDISDIYIIPFRKISSIIISIAKYIITDSSLDPSFIKRKEQIVISTWHGTPFKVMGRCNQSEKHSLGGVQQTFLKSDYLIFANKYMKDTIIRDYMLENICQAKCLLSGYPRNAIFFDNTEYFKQRNRMGLSGQIIVYMPTFRGTIFEKKNYEQVKIIYEYLSYIDNVLNDDQTFFVKLHNFNDISIDFSKFNRVKRFPSEYATYDVLAATDILVTDYSSVFFDFVNTGRKVILFTYDSKEYIEDRGVYFKFDILPFKNVVTVDELIDEINSNTNIDYSDFINTFGYYDNKECTQNICNHIFNMIPSCKEENIYYNKKENILIYAGSMKKNGITSALFNLLSMVDITKYNYIISYCRHEVDNHINQINIIPSNINYAPIADKSAPTLYEYVMYKIFHKTDIKINDSHKYNVKIYKSIEKFISREWTRFYGSARIHKVLQFDGYGSYVPLMFALSNKPSAIWVHNDLVQEKIVRNFNNMKVIMFLYKKYKKVIMVNDALLPSTLQLGALHKNILTIYNPFNHISFIEKSKDKLKIEKDTCIYGTDFNKLENKIRSYSIRFITIGRFSPEKGHSRLIHAFSEFHKTHPDSCLFIIGGHGPLFMKTVNLVKSLDCRKHIIIIQSLMNVAPYIKLCNCFIFSSLYEGLGLVLLEATSLGIPVISTRIVAVEKFMEKFGGFCVDDSKEGLLFGMNEFYKGNVHPLKIDFENFNKESINKFYDLLDNL